MTSPFYPDSTLMFAWNSSALGTFKDCPRKFQLAYIEGWTPKGDSIHLRFGQLYHKGLEHYDIQRNLGLSDEDALDFVVDMLLQDTWDNRNEDGTDGHPWDTSSHNAGAKKNRETLVRSVIWYIDHYLENPVEIYTLESGKKALELTFTMEIPAHTPRGEPYLLTGHMDSLVDFAGELFVMDRKTSGSTLGAYFFDKFNPDNQMSLYTLAARTLYSVPVSGVIIDAAQIAVGFTSFARGFATRSQNQLNEWLADTAVWLKAAEAYSAADYWPMNDNSCHKYDGCQFRRICRADPIVRRNFLETDFTISRNNTDRILEGEG